MTYTIAPNEPPTAGQPETFTATYPQSARKKYGPRQHNNPQVELVCGGEIAGVMPMADETRQSTGPDGTWEGVSYPITIPAAATSCSASVYSFDADGLTVWASVSFDVA